MKMIRFGLMAALGHLALMTAAVDEAGSAGGGAEDKPTVEKGPGVGDLAKTLLREKKTNEEVLAAIKEAFPEAKTSMASVNWYRNNLRGAGEDVPTARELKADSREADKKAKDAKKAQDKIDKAAQKALDKANKGKGSKTGTDADAGGEAGAGSEEGGEKEESFLS